VTTEKKQGLRSDKTSSRAERVNWAKWVFAFALGFSVAVCLFAAIPSGVLLPRVSVRSGVNSSGDSSSISSYADLLALPAARLDEMDIARMSLLCAEGLRGSESLDIYANLSTLDNWSEQIRKDTDARMAAYLQNPAKYDNSVNKFKVVNMVLMLKNVIGVDYNKEIMERRTFPDSRDVFIHGCLDGKKQGGCISIPTLCVAAGRRLGYPLKLVLTKEHVFFRWDGKGEVFNIEACCPGCDSKPDDYYMKWPYQISAADVKANGYLKSLTAGEELALFMDTRGECLYDAGKVGDAMVCYSMAYQLMPDSLEILAHVQMAMNNRIDAFKRMMPSAMKVK
jgi:hypothetical protein